MINILNIYSKEFFEEFIKEKSVVKFSADWCGPCNVLSKNIINLNENKVNNFKFGEINVDDDFAEEITGKFGIRNIPVLVYFNNGKEIKRSIGLKTTEELYKELNDVDN